jgi:ketosteroid isomerase-like protein
MSEANKKVALDFLAAMDAGDGEAMDRCLTRDAFTNTQGFAGVSGQRSREMMVATASAFKDIVPTGFRPKMKKVVAEGDAVVLEFEGDAVLSSGEAYCNQYVFVFSFEGGKIKQLNEYFCTVLADRVMLPLLAQKGAEYAQGDAS